MHRPSRAQAFARYLASRTQMHACRNMSWGFRAENWCACCGGDAALARNYTAAYSGARRALCTIGCDLSRAQSQRADWRFSGAADNPKTLILSPTRRRTLILFRSSTAGHVPECLRPSLTSRTRSSYASSHRERSIWFATSCRGPRQRGRRGRGKQRGESGSTMCPRNAGLGV